MALFILFLGGPKHGESSVVKQEPNPTIRIPCKTPVKFEAGSIDPRRIYGMNYTKFEYEDAIYERESTKRIDKDTYEFRYRYMEPRKEPEEQNIEGDFDILFSGGPWDGKVLNFKSPLRKLVLGINVNSALRLCEYKLSKCDARGGSESWWEYVFSGYSKTKVATTLVSDKIEDFNRRRQIELP